MSFIQRIARLNPTRGDQSQLRRQLKLLEEVGEVAEAYGHFTHPQNPKGKTATDVAEELIDVAIMAYDLALTGRPVEMFPYDPEKTDGFWEGDPTLQAIKKLVGSVIASENPRMYAEPAEDLGDTAYQAAIGLIGLEAAAALLDAKLRKWERQIAKGQDLCSRTAAEQ